MAPAIVPVTPSPIIQKFCKPVSSVSLKRLGAYSTNPLRLTKKGPLSDVNVRDGGVLEDVEQIDTNLFQVEIVDDDGHVNRYTVIVPD